MSEDNPAIGLVSEDDLNRLTELFRQIEGAFDPLSDACREAEWEFNSLIEKIHTEIVKPNFQSVSITQFRCFTRNYCRARISRQGPPFPCT